MPVVANCLLILAATWTAELPPNAPTELQLLVDVANVEIEYVSDPEFVRKDNGNCAFNLSFSRKFKYRFSTSRKGGQSIVRVTVTSIEPAVSVTHKIRIPIRYATPEPWSKGLLRHEFDHVAISSDPRPQLLISHLARHLPPIEYVLQPREKADAELYKRLINAELDRREDAVTEVIRRNYQLLDEVSRHGTVPIPNRGDFFAELYSKEHLASLKFPFVEEALSAFETEAFLNAELLHLERDPTEN